MVSSGKGSVLARAAKLLLVEGVDEGGVGLEMGGGVFLLFRLLEGTLVNPSASSLSPAF